MGISSEEEATGQGGTLNQTEIVTPNALDVIKGTITTRTGSFHGSKTGTANKPLMIYIEDGLKAGSIHGLS